MRLIGKLGMRSTVGVGLAMLIAATASAQGRPGGPRGPGRGGPPEPSELMKNMDKNDDGKLTKDEVPEPLWARLSAADANDDGAVTLDEFAKMVRERRGGGPDARTGPPFGRGGGPDARTGPPFGRGGGPDARTGPPFGRGGGPDTRTGPPFGRGGGPDARTGPPFGRGGGPDARTGPPVGRGGRAVRTDQKKGDEPEKKEPEKQERKKAGERPERRGPGARRADGSEMADRVFDRLDKDGNGSISKEEFKSGFTSRFASARGARGPMAMRGRSGQGPGRASAVRRPQMRGLGGPPWAPGRGSFGKGPSPWSHSFRGGQASRFSPWGSWPGSFGNRGSRRPGPAINGPHRGPHGGPAANRGGFRGGPRRGFQGPGAFRFGATDTGQDDVVSDSELEAEKVEIAETQVADSAGTTDSQDTIVTENE